MISTGIARPGVVFVERSDVKPTDEKTAEKGTNWFTKGITPI